MKRFLCLLFFFPFLSYSQWTTDTLLNTQVSQNPSLEEATPLMTEGPDGKTYISYFKSNGSQYEMYIQMLDSMGNKLWGTAGLVISSFPQNSALFRYDLKSDRQGNAILAFQDERLGYLSVVAYKLDPAGTFMWGTSGVQLGDNLASEDLSPSIGITSSNDVIVAWNSNNGGPKWVAFQKVSSNGIIAWSRTHRCIDSTFVKKFSRPAIVPLDNDRFMMMVIQETGSFPFTNTMFMNKYDSDGETVATPVQVSAKTTSFFDFPKIVAKNTEGAIIGFNTSHPVVSTMNDVYVQYVDSNLALPWSLSGTELSASVTEHKNIASLHYQPDSNKVFCMMKVLDGSQSNAGIFVQKLDASGANMLGMNAHQVFPVSATYYDPFGASDLGNGMVLVYTIGGFGNEHIRAIKTDYGGVPSWSGDVAVCSMNSNKDDGSVSAYRNGQVVVSWQDDRSGSGIYAQNILGNGSLGIPNGLAPMAAHGRNVFVDYQTFPRLIVESPQPGYAMIRLTDMSGRVLLQKRIYLEGKMALPLENFSPGLYLFSVIDGSAASFRILIPQ